MLAADLQLSSYLELIASKGRIIFEVAYSEYIGHAREKAKRYLWESDFPRPSVVVLFDAVQKITHDEYRDLPVRFEILRRSTADAPELQTYESSVSLLIAACLLPDLCQPKAMGEESRSQSIQCVWPRVKAEMSTNTQNTAFSLVEIFGSVESLDLAIAMRQDLESIEDRERRTMLEDVKEGTLEILREKIGRNEQTKLPIRYITDTLARRRWAQADQDRMVKRKRASSEPDQSSEKSERGQE